MIYQSTVMLCSYKDPRMETFFAILAKYWAWNEMSVADHAAINGDLNNEEEADDADDPVFIPDPYQPVASSAMEPELERDDEPSTRALRTAFRRMNTGGTLSSGSMPPPPVPVKSLLPPLPKEVLPSNPADLRPEDRLKIEARIAALRWPDL